MKYFISLTYWWTNKETSSECVILKSDDDDCDIENFNGHKLFILKSYVSLDKLISELKIRQNSYKRVNSIQIDTETLTNEEITMMKENFE